jgi:hypothetical protein
MFGRMPMPPVFFMQSTCIVQGGQNIDAQPNGAIVLGSAILFDGLIVLKRSRTGSVAV